MTGRTTLNWWRILIDGRDMSGYSRSFGPLACTFEEGVDDAVTLSVKQTWPGNATVSMGTLNGLFDNTASVGIHAILKSVTTYRNVMIPAGIQAAPADNDPVFVGQFAQLGYETGPSDNPVTASVNFANTSAIASNLNYARPWGTLLWSLAAKIAANTATGIDQLAPTSLGGYMMYQVFAGNGTASIKVQDAAANVDGSFTDLLSSGSLDFSTPKSGIVALVKNATVKRYVRFQIALGTATTVTFALAFSRGN